MQADAALNQKLQALTKLHPHVIDMGLERVEALLADLGNPHLQLPPVIHIAGTNGKGSSLATLRAILEAAGHHCHVMTSPHLVHFNERIVIRGQNIATPDLVDILHEVERVNAGRPITFFEITTVAGLLAFARTPADYVLLETGMGGRLDATNVIKQPLLTIITMISYDHQSYLGHSLPEIAGEKAGILKQNVPCIIGQQTSQAQDENVMAVFEKRAASLHAPLFRAGYEWSSRQENQNMIFNYQTLNLHLPLPSLIGQHQIQNAGNAVMAAHLISGITQEHIAKGLTQIHWPGRLQKLQGQEIYIDGGHNDSAGMILAQQAQQWHTQDQKPLHLVLGMLSTKDPVCFIKPLAPYLASVTCVTIPDEPLSFSAEDLCKMLQPMLDCPVTTSTPEMAVLSQKIDGRRLITGSLYLAGWVLKTLQK